MQPVWIMSEDEKNKAAGGAVILLLLFGIVVGGIWGYNWLFPSESSQIWDAREHKSNIDKTFKDSEWDINSLSSATAQKEAFTADQLTNVGDNLHRLKQKVSAIRSDIARLTKLANRLKKSDNVDTQLQGTGYAQHATDAAEKLKALEAKANELEDKLSKKLAGN